MVKVIVTTTINPVTEAVERFQALRDWHLVVIGDKKTPRSYRLTKGTYVSPEEQEAYDKELSDAVGWNCTARRSFGFLWAHDMGADVVAVVDDDNIPYDGWGEDIQVGREVEVDYYETDLPAFDPVGATNHGHLWHRGYPLQLLSQRDYSRRCRKVVRPDIQADFWDGDPDIDALCRMQHAPECRFDPSFFPMAGNRISPFDSQNTFLSGEILADYFMFPCIGRMEDIWAGYYSQAKGHKVIYGRPSVYQQRNPHNLVKDMTQEYLGYEFNLDLINDLAADPDSILKYLPESSVRAFKLYRRHFSKE